MIDGDIPDILHYLMDRIVETYDGAPTILVSQQTYRRLRWHQAHGARRYRRSVHLRKLKRRQHRAAFRRKKRGLA